LTKNIDSILEALIKNCNIIKDNKEQDDAETRKYAITSIVTIFCKVGTKVIDHKKFQIIIDQCIYVLTDYSTDRRGDIGSLVREAGMYAIFNLISSLCTNESKEVVASYLNKENIQVLLGNLLQQLAEKIDKMRLIAGSIVQRIFDNYSDILPDFDQKQDLYDIFCNKTIKVKVEEDNDRIDEHFDVSLLNDAMF